MAEEEDVLEGDEPESGVFRWMSALVVLLAVAGFFGLAWYAYKNGGEAVDDKDVELIKADKTPVKEAPANPGGMQIPNQDKTVYGLISGKAEKPVVERILPAPEEPIARSGDTETWMSDSAKNKSGGVEQENPSTPAAAPPFAPAQQTGEQGENAPKEQFNPAKARATQVSQTQEIPVTAHVSVVAAADPAQAPAIAPQPKPNAATPAAPATATPAPAAANPAPAPAVKATPAPDKNQTAANDSDASDDNDDDKPEAQPAAQPASKPPAGARVQLGAYKSQGEAEDRWAKISRHFADDLKAKQHYVVRVDLGSKGVYYRLQVAPFSSAKDAEQFCLDFVSAGQGCILARGK